MPGVVAFLGLCLDRLEDRFWYTRSSHVQLLYINTYKCTLDVQVKYMVVREDKKQPTKLFR